MVERETARESGGKEGGWWWSLPPPQRRNRKKIQVTGIRDVDTARSEYIELADVTNLVSKSESDVTTRRSYERE